jgi:hypothetical protein
VERRRGGAGGDDVTGVVGGEGRDANGWVGGGDRGGGDSLGDIDSGEGLSSLRSVSWFSAGESGSARNCARREEYGCVRICNGLGYSCSAGRDGYRSRL